MKIKIQKTHRKKCAKNEKKKIELQNFLTSEKVKDKEIAKYNQSKVLRKIYLFHMLNFCKICSS